jgi:hypothetical protein
MENIIKRYQFVAGVSLLPLLFMTIMGGIGVYIFISDIRQVKHILSQGGNWEMLPISFGLIAFLLGNVLGLISCVLFFNIHPNNPERLKTALDFRIIGWGIYLFCQAMLVLFFILSETF